MTADQDKARREDLFLKDIQSALRKETAEMDPNEGLEQFMAAVAANPKPRTSWWKKLNSWLGDMGFSPALGSGLAVAQLGIIVALLIAPHSGTREQSPETAYRGAPGQAQKASDLKITINPDADFASLVSLLRANQCRIIAGPSESGELWVVVDDKNRLVETRRALVQSSLIDDVAVRQ